MLRACLRSAAKRAASSGFAGAVFAGGRAMASSAAKSLSTAEATTLFGGAFLLGTTTTAFASAAALAAAPSNRERSFIMVKPDGMNRGLAGDIIARFEKKGYKLVAAKVIVPSRDLASRHYAEHDGKPFFPALVDFLTSGPVLALVFEGAGVVKSGRELIGKTNPQASAPGTIRGDYGITVGRNIIHGSDGVESAQREIALWFTPDEVAIYGRVIDTWLYE